MIIYSRVIHVCIKVLQLNHLDAAIYKTSSLKCLLFLLVLLSSSPLGYESSVACNNVILDIVEHIDC